MTSWREYWSTNPSVYVSERHGQAHDRVVARDVLAAIPHGRAVLLDYGCGEARSAGDIARACGRLYLCDGSAPVRQRLAGRFGGEPAIRILAPEDVQAAAGMAAVADGSVELAIMCSVLQYLPAGERDRVLGVLARKLAPGGELIVADVISPGHGVLADMADLLRLAVAEGFLMDALTGLVRLALSDYSKQRGALGLARYDDAEMAAVLARAGLSCRKLACNLGPNRGRSAYAARRLPEPRPVG